MNTRNFNLLRIVLTVATISMITSACGKATTTAATPTLAGRNSAIGSAMTHASTAYSNASFAGYDQNMLTTYTGSANCPVSGTVSVTSTVTPPTATGSNPITIDFTGTSFTATYNTCKVAGSDGITYTITGTLVQTMGGSIVITTSGSNYTEVGTMTMAAVSSNLALTSSDGSVNLGNGINISESVTINGTQSSMSVSGTFTGTEFGTTVSGSF